ncbi:MAG: SET domain-containing protein [Bacteroidota bacterium]
MKKTVEELPDNIDAKESDYLYLKTSGIKNSGNGLFTSIPIFKNEVISLFKGEILSNKEASLRASNRNDGYFINMLDGTIMDSKNVNCFAKYANDSEGFKITKWKNNSKIALDENNKVCLVATKDIKSSEEIFCGYGKAYWKNFKK